MRHSLRLVSQRRGGFLWHYGHFMHDLLVPLTLLKQRELPELAKVYLDNTPEQSPGVFGPVVEELTGIALETLSPGNFNALSDVPSRTLQGLGFGPYTFRDLHDFLSGMESRFQLLDVRSPKVLLLDRGHQELGFSGHPASSTGAGRRRIGNHQEIVDALAARHGHTFRSVVLEDMTPLQQARLFYNAELIIGEHGAGLANLFFTRPGTRVIELNPIYAPTFVHIADAKPLRYQALGGFPDPLPRADLTGPPLRVEVDVDELLAAIAGTKHRPRPPQAMDTRA